MAFQDKFATDRHHPDGQWVRATTVEKVVGVHYRKENAVKFANAARVAERKGLIYEIQLEHQPNHPHDGNAIAVYEVSETKGWLRNGVKEWHIGYISRGLSSEIFAEFISHNTPIAAELLYIYEGESGFLDFNIIVLAPPGNSVSTRMKRKRAK